ncbi:MAG: ATP-dependent Clp protease adapter ClpS [Alphaproteobacteria bacterium]|nr:ATP-dependent Clp protease adapter ClpS [Alphaproteobacteria bacterium]
MFDPHAPSISAHKFEFPPDCGNPEVAILVCPKIKRPSQYRVLMLNDDYTPMDFVVHVLAYIFHKSTEEAITLMLQVHHQGQVMCGVYPYEIAETKVAQVTALAREEQHPLRCTMEKKS